MKERNIHRCEEKSLAFIAEIAQADFGAFEHIGALVIFVSQKDQAHIGKMVLQILRSIAADDHYPVDTRLL